MATTIDNPHQNSPALFGVLVLPYGFTSSVASLLMPYLLRKNNVPVNEIANVVAIASIPFIWAFVWSPIADAGFKRRTWLMISAFASALAGCAAILSIHGSLTVLTALLFLMNALGALVSSCCGGLLTAMPESLRGRCGGWYQGGNLGGAAIGGGLVIWLADHASLPVVAMAIFAAMTLPALAAMWIQEPPVLKQPLRKQFAGLAHDFREVFTSRRALLSLVFFLSPVGSAALGNLISSVGQDYQAPGDIVLLVSGIGGGLLSAFGCLIGGFLADKMSRMKAYAMAGGMAAAFALYLSMGPPTVMTYALGYSGYCVASGLAFAVYTALILDVVGKRKHAAASAYSVLNACGNVPVVYMTWLDGVGYSRWGTRGLMATDAAANGVFGLVLFLVAIFAGHHWHHRAKESELATEAA